MLTPLTVTETYAEEKEAGDDPLDEIERELAEEEAGVEPEEEEKEDDD